MCFFAFKRSPSRADWRQAMAAIAASSERFEQQLDTLTTGQAGILIRPTNEQTPNQTKAEIERGLSGADRSQIQFDVTLDDTGHGWVVVSHTKLAGVATGVANIQELLSASGLGDRVVAAVFPFRWHDSVRQDDRRIYWIYQPRIRGFTPFVPDGEPDAEQRDHSLELRMESAIRRDLPTFRETSEWYPLWGMPI